MLKIPQRANTLCGIFAREKCEKATNHETDIENGNICVGGLLICAPTESRKKCPDRHSGPGLLVIHQNRDQRDRDQRASFRIV